MVAAVLFRRRSLRAASIDCILWACTYLVLRYPQRKVGVFFCGPAVLSKALYIACNKHSKLGGTIFRFHKENF